VKKVEKQKTTKKVEEKTKRKQNRKAVTVIDSISYEVKPKETLYSLSKCLT
jgi:translation initiation factor 1 (eIF-1/SUI1)